MTKARNNRYRAALSRRKFVAIDGEAFEDHYALMANSNGAYIFNENGLPTHDCLEFLLGSKATNPGYKLVAFGLGYDVNMILRDLTQGELERLWTRQRVTVTLQNETTYILEWIPAKKFSVRRAFGHTATAHVSDVFGFYQSSFVKALEQWKIPDEGGHIARMKAERGTFTLEQKSSVISYCVAECRLLVELMHRLEDSLDAAELRPSSWVGAGSVAGRLLQREQIQDYRVPDEEFPPQVYDAIMRAYFGGRVEVFLQGVFSNVTAYDIRSAYPSECLQLPDLHGTWTMANGYDPAKRYALWRVRWRVLPNLCVMPFPHRKDRTIYYPSNGEGWYHAKEVRVAKQVYGDAIEILEGWTYEPHSTIKPFSFVRKVYEERAEAKRRGDASEKALKLGLNSLYGKMAQGIGYRGRIPAFRSFFWAGAITSGTRARMLDLASANPRGVVSMATDGIIFSGDPDFVESDVLGGLERTAYRELFVAQPGIYRAIDHDGEELQKSRGFFLREIDFPDLIDGWLKEGPYYTQKRDSKRFVGLGVALMQRDMSKWRHWVEGERKLNLHTSRKFYECEKGKVMRLLPPTYDTVQLSQQYVPKKTGVEMYDETRDFVQGLEQPLKVL